MDIESNPDVTVVIVNYNVKDYLLQCLRSLDANRGGVSYQVVVVDNASQDGSVQELRPLFPSVKWISLTENIGFGRANNRGLQECTGRYVLFLNPDTIVGEDTLSTMVEYMDAHSDVGIAGCKVLNPDGSFQVACRRGLPTPWASFCKLFGLQTLFPKSQLFARYNLTYRSIDETYNVDALIGAFMIAPLHVVEQVGGFDPQFFMYGEDIDLCYRIQQSGLSVRYVHTTSIIHYKGESTKRSSMNEVRVFYDAMEKFARKHFGGSRAFLFLLRLGIYVRAIVARAVRKNVEISVWALDMLSLNAALLIATSVRFDGPFGFPDYAYPLVPMLVSVVVSLALVSVGEYVEYRPTIRRSVIGLLIAFFFISSLTYFFNEYAFSRGVLLMTIGLTALLMAIVRGAFTVVEGVRGKARVRKILLVGINERTAEIATELQRAEHRNAQIVGVVATGPFSETRFAGLPIVGDSSYLERILDATGAQEVILTDANVHGEQAMNLMIASSAYRARFHLAADYDEIVTARIINDVAGIEPTVHISPLLRFRNRFAKRFVDVLVSVAILLLGLPGLFLAAGRKWLGTWVDVAVGKKSIVGTYPDGVSRPAGKVGLTGLVHISQPEALSEVAITQLNDYYVSDYTQALDIEILLKLIFGRNRGKHVNTRI